MFTCFFYIISLRKSFFIRHQHFKSYISLLETTVEDMNNLIRSLEYLCIEKIGSHIYQLSRTNKDQWVMNHSPNLGDRLILASLANSFFTGLDDTTFDYIFHNFIVKKMRIYPKILEKLKFFDFLNGKELEELEIIVEKDIKLKSPRNFRLTTKKLKLNIQSKDKPLRRSLDFYKNLFVEDEIFITAFGNDSYQLIILAEIILSIIKNSSSNLESLAIHFKCLHHQFCHKFLELLKEKSHLKYFFLDYSNCFANAIKVDDFSSSLIDLSSFSLASISCQWSLAKLYECFKYCSNLTRLVIFFSDYKLLNDLNQVKEFFSLLHQRNSETLKELAISLPELPLIESEFSGFVKSCRRLERFTFLEKLSTTVSETAFISILPNSHHLKILELKYSAIKINEIKTWYCFFSHVNLNDLCLMSISFEKNCFTDFLRLIETLQPKITSIQFLHCNIHEKELEYFPKALTKLHFLKQFNINGQLIPGELFLDLFLGFMSSKNTLEKICINRCSYNVKLRNINKMLHFFTECKTLKSIKIEVDIEVSLITQLIQSLYKYQSTLEEIDLNFCYSSEKFDELLCFLSGCSVMRSVSGYAIIGKSLWYRILQSLKNSKYTLKEFPSFELIDNGVVLNYPKHFASRASFL